MMLAQAKELNFIIPAPMKRAFAVMAMERLMHDEMIAFLKDAPVADPALDDLLVQLVCRTGHCLGKEFRDGISRHICW